MNAVNKIFIGVLAVFIFSFASIAHAEEVDPYFAWEIKNPDDYQGYNSIFKECTGNNNIDIRDEIYNRITLGLYLEAAILCRMIEPYQKVAHGVHYFDADLTKLTAKLYLATDELDAAELKINSLTANAFDNQSKVHALNLKSDLLNRRGNFGAALQTAQEVAALSPDEKMRLLNQLHMARAYCGLDKLQESLKIFNEIYQSLPDSFGESSSAPFSLASFGAELARKFQQNDNAKSWLLYKDNQAQKLYEQTNNMPVAVDSRIDLAEFYFETGDASNGRKMLDNALDLNDVLNGKMGGPLPSGRLYKKINRIAVKHLGENHPIALQSAFSIVYTNNTFGEVQEAVDFYKKNLSTFQKTFGEDYVDSLEMMDQLKYGCLALGRYDDAQKVAEEYLGICRQYLDDDNFYTISAAIDLAGIYYRTGKYKTADKLLDDLKAQNIDFFAKNPAPNDAYNFLFKKALGAYMRGDIFGYAECLRTIDKLNDQDTTKYYSEMVISPHYFNLFMEELNFLATTGVVHNYADTKISLLSLSDLMGLNRNLNALKTMNDVAESCVKYGDLKGAERYINQILRLSKASLGEGNFYEWMALNTLSKVRRAEGNFTSALDLDNKALHIAETVCGKKSLERLKSLDATASDHALAGNLAEAIKIRERTLADYKKILEDTDAATIQMMTNLAENYVAAGRYAHAVKLCDETLAAQKVPAYVNNHLSFFPTVTELIRIKATAQKLSGDFANAYTNYKDLIQAYEANRHASDSVNSSLSGVENKTHWFAEKVPTYRDAAAVAAIASDADFAFYCVELCKGRNLIDRFNDVLVAKTYLLTPAERQLLTEKQNHLDSCRNIIEYAANDEELLRYSEIAYNNLHVFLENFKSELREKYATNKIPKDSPKRDKTAINLFLTELLDLNVWEQPKIWDRSEILKNFDVKKNRQAIPNDACLIEFLKVSDDSLVVTFTGRKGDIQATIVPINKNFFERCRLYHELNSYPNAKILMDYHKKYLLNVDGNYVISDRREHANPNAFLISDNEKFNAVRQEVAAELSATLMPTLEKFAGSSRHWIISPDAELNLVPFETLNGSDGLLIETKDVSYVPSLAVMTLMKNREWKNSYLKRSKDLFAMGDAVYDNAIPTTPHGGNKKFLWKKLANASRELDNVSTFFKSKAIFRHEQVSEKNLRELNANGELAKYKYLLFATHGVFDSERPELSSIVLSQQFNDADNDGYVTIGEWMGYDLRSDLIYLSACESGRGDYPAGEGIIGIPYALTMAGNKDTVMSLWKVNDKATADFTAAVFNKLSRGQSEVQALNETKREFLRQENSINQNPTVWAAFVLYGI